MERICESSEKLQVTYVWTEKVCEIHLRVLRRVTQVIELLLLAVFKLQLLVVKLDEWHHLHVSLACVCDCYPWVMLIEAPIKQASPDETELETLIFGVKRLSV